MSLKSSAFYLLIVCILFTNSLSQSVVSGGTRIDSIASPASVKLDRERGLNMLKEIRDAIKENYYDKNFRGIDLDGRYQAAREEIKKLEMNAQIFGVIAEFVLQFNDSHTRFYPPGRANRAEYGFTMQMIGDKCFALNVKKNGPAEAAGMKEGDRIITIGQFAPTRGNLWVINYILYSLNPQERLDILAADVDGRERRIKIQTSFKSIKEREQEEREKRKKNEKEEPYKCHEFTSDVIACRLDTFAVGKNVIDRIMKLVAGHSKLILDLRGNSGGYVKIEEYLVGHFFDRDVKIGDLITRKKSTERIAKSQKSKVFGGELIVLIDSNSASASEVFARVMQIEKRGKIIGDVSAGAVMTSWGLSMSNVRGVSSFLTFSVYGLNLTIGDLIMSDGNRLENVGVIPNVPIGPTQRALAEKNDPILAYAAGVLGAQVTEKDAGDLHFILPKEEGDNEKSDKDDEKPDN